MAALSLKRNFLQATFEWTNRLKKLKFMGIKYLVLEVPLTYEDIISS